MLAPRPEEIAARARTDLRCGLPVRVGELVVAPVETLDAARTGAMAGAPLAITRRRAEALKARVYDGDLALVAPPAVAGAGWARALADPSGDMGRVPAGPLMTLRGADPATLAAARVGIALCKEAHLLPAVLVGRAEAAGLTALPSDGIPPPMGLLPVVGARVPLALAARASVQVHRPPDGRAEHYAVRLGAPDPDAPVLCRIHSACFTGDVLGSLKCDCGPQLQAALAAMAEEGGILLYLNQEGRGIGLASKMRAYALQDRGLDTVEANHRLGFEDDERRFALAADMLRGLGVPRVRLMTNNPRKLEQLAATGIEVAGRVPLHVGRGAANAHYLDVKRLKSGHLE